LSGLRLSTIVSVLRAANNRCRILLGLAINETAVRCAKNWWRKDARWRIVAIHNHFSCFAGWIMAFWKYFDSVCMNEESGAATRLRRAAVSVFFC
jgi:hypothetical protein